MVFTFTKEQLNGDMLRASQDIPRDTIFISLEGVDLSLAGDAYWKNIFSHFPAGALTLNLGRTNFGRVSPEVLIEIFKTAPAFRTVSLHNNNLGLWSSSEHLSALLVALKTAHSVDLSDNNLQHFGGRALNAAFNNFSETVRCLDLSNNRLLLLPASQLAMAFQALTHVEELNLSLNSLGVHEDLAQAFASFHRNLKQLTIISNELGERHPQLLAAALQAIR